MIFAISLFLLLFTVNRDIFNAREPNGFVTVFWGLVMGIAAVYVVVSTYMITLEEGGTCVGNNTLTDPQTCDNDSVAKWAPQECTSNEKMFAIQMMALALVYVIYQYLFSFGPGRDADRDAATGAAQSAAADEPFEPGIEDTRRTKKWKMMTIGSLHRS